MLEYRRIFKSQQTGIETIRELLQSMFVGEMLIVGEKVWIVSPWISNVVLVDNRSGSFNALNPEWSGKEVRLNDVLIALMLRGCDIVIVTRDDQESNIPFINKVKETCEVAGVLDKLTIVIRNKLHTKGILLSKSLLLGSMNITYYGIEMNEETIQFSISPEEISRTRLEFNKYLEDV